MNHIKTLLLMSLLTVLLIVLGGAIAGEQGLIMAFGFALVLNLFSFWFSDSIALRMTRSREVSASEQPQLHAMIERLSRNAGLPMPKVYLTPSSQPNAFATGRNPRHAAVAVTEGIMRILDESELEGVIAHELAHIKNRDTLISTIATVMAGALAFIARMGQYRMIFGGIRGSRNNNAGGAAVLIQLVAIIFAPIAALLIKMAISRSREFIADASGARIAGSPDGLARALLKMEQHAQGHPMRINEAASHMFIINPLSRQGMARMFSTHPPIQERVQRLRSIERRRGA
ncbi:MAG: protease HtpX [Spirochaetaceae bacterium]|nr:MAG: protease HtpX [Spirochaetaceae bacterium]